MKQRHLMLLKCGQTGTLIFNVGNANLYSHYRNNVDNPQELTKQSLGYESGIPDTHCWGSQTANQSFLWKLVRPCVPIKVDREKRPQVVALLINEFATKDGDLWDLEVGSKTKHLLPQVFLWHLYPCSGLWVWWDTQAYFKEESWNTFQWAVHSIYWIHTNISFC